MIQYEKYLNHAFSMGIDIVNESVIKAIPDKISLKNICILNSKHKPEIKINGKLNKKYDFIASVSHEKEFAIAVVISFRK